MNTDALLNPPEGYLVLECLVGIGSFPNNTEDMLKEAGLDTRQHFGDPPEAVLSAVYFKKGSLDTLHLIADLRCDAVAGGAVTLTIDPETRRRCLGEVPPEFDPMIHEAQSRPF
ncbi:hypothetical protein C8J47_0128 [Sphingomonas sp. PP-F2F-G114-C0414]|uniref:hypothetical protein n=1 Tax=Sphingomonas sp. PP-F2F-G114-C0414 TaxID=2135662 RepID=UPI000F2A8B4F|nr:hypothetical protein [Sphingomonas sp. PP-F2F-G114-C0414]RMB39165.1 hypothetical protein C8J47_0128 [Sphingomonas sp. PP-F2F-G114-C0414]